MNGIAISVNNLSKKYRLYDNPKDRLKEALNPFRKKYHHDFWALRDVSFEVKKGETVGIIGRNGSGKSTLLQIICGVLQPTAGDVEVNGKISALLELGAGFNPEFTGRQNVYMNSALIGLSRDEIDDRFDDIASFADIGEFIDQPVKTYSSGMYVRLAFAAAINVDPDILIVDEALAVGDELFQRKCFSKIKTFSESGKTILFVSHSGTTIIERCNNASLFDGGELILRGKPKTVVSRYQKLLYSKSEDFPEVRREIVDLNRYLENEGRVKKEPGGEKIVQPEQQPEDLRHTEGKEKPFFVPSLQPQSRLEYKSYNVDIQDIAIQTLSGERVNVLVMNEDYVYSYRVKFNIDAFKVSFGMCFKTIKGLEIGWCEALRNEYIEYVASGQEFLVEWRFQCTLLPGVYYTNASALGFVGGVNVFLNRITDALVFKVQEIPNNMYGGIVNFGQYPIITQVKNQ